MLRQCQASDIQAANNLKPACEPRQSIEYLQDPNDIRQGISLIPDQISVQRCSGSCLDNNVYQSCVASQTRTRTIQVFRNLSYFGILSQSREFQVVQKQMIARGQEEEQCREMEIVDDLECQCGCRISEEDCLSTQVIQNLLL